MATWLTERFGLTVPVVAAPMAGASRGELAAAIVFGLTACGGSDLAAWGQACILA